MSAELQELPPRLRDWFYHEMEAQRELGARVTLLMYEAHKAGRRTVTLRELLEAVGEPHHRQLKEQMIWLEMEWHDNWSCLEAAGGNGDDEPAP